MSETRQLNFSGGEITPSLYARVDQSKYQSGLRTCKNMMVMKHGGLKNRPGTEYIIEVKDSSKQVRLIPFIFNNDQTYVLEFGDLYIRFIKDDAQIESGGSPVEVTTPYVDADLRDLRYVQSGDTITIVHPSYAPRELTRTSDTSWALNTISFGTTLTPPVMNTLSNFPPFTYGYVATIEDIDTGEESLISNRVFTIATPSTSSPLTVSGTADTSNRIVHIYKSYAGLVYGYVGSTSPDSSLAFQFVDDGIVPDFEDNPPIQQDVFNASDDYPSAVTYSGNRILYGGSNNNPERIWGSRIGLYKYFNTTTPITDDASLYFDLLGAKVSRVKHLTEVRQLLALSNSTEWAINGNSAGIVTPSEINAKHQTFNGVADVAPLQLEGTLIYLQDRGTIVRDFLFDFETDGYRGNDLSIFSAHLFKNKTIVEWSYEQNPDSIIWAVRSDGVLLGLTYVREQGIVAWHRHVTDGTYESVVTIPDGTKDSTYVVVNRTINGSTVRYIEKMADRDYSDILDSVFADSVLKYDGRNTNTSLSMTLSTGGSDWTHEGTLDLTASSSYFVAGDVGNTIHITDANDVTVICTILTYTSGTAVVVRPDRTVPTAMRNTAITDWAKGVDELSGLDHLEGESVSVFADGFVVASPNNSNYNAITVSSGAITLPEPRTVIHVGLPYVSDVETLDIDTISGRPVGNYQKIVNEINMYIEDSRGIFAGSVVPSDDGISGLREYANSTSDDLADPPATTTGNINIPINSKWSNHGRVLIRQVDPLPLKILAITPIGEFPRGG